MNTFKVQFLSPDYQISFDNALSLALHGLDGQIVILANHAPYFIYLLPGIITLKISTQEERKIVIDSGILEVRNNVCSILANQVQAFDRAIHNEQSLQAERLNIQLSYQTSL